MHNELIMCLQCGKKFHTLRRHLKNAHNLTREEYISLYKLPVDFCLWTKKYQHNQSKRTKHRWEDPLSREKLYNQVYRRHESLPDIMEFIKKLQDLRVNVHKITLKKLANEIGIGESYLCQIERGLVYPSPLVIQKLSDFFKVDFKKVIIEKEQRDKYYFSTNNKTLIICTTIIAFTAIIIAIIWKI